MSEKDWELEFHKADKRIWDLTTKIEQLEAAMRNLVEAIDSGDIHLMLAMEEEAKSALAKSEQSK